MNCFNYSRLIKLIGFVIAFNGLFQLESHGASEHHQAYAGYDQALQVSSAKSANPEQLADIAPKLPTSVKHTNAAQTLPIKRQKGKVHIQIDGEMSESIWNDVASYSQFFEYAPEIGKHASSDYKTDVKMIIDDEALYIAIRAWDTAPELIEANLTRRDHVEHDQDFVGILLDAAGHGRSAQFVRVNVAGVLSDGIYRPQDDEFDLGPDFPIDAAVKRMPDGYQLELRWPLRNLRFPYEGGKTWLAMIERSIPHANHLHLTSAPLQTDDLNFLARLQELDGMEDTVQSIRDRQFVDVTPVLSLQHKNEGGKTSFMRSLGVDISARPRADVVLNAMINPDFSDIDIDEPSTAGASRIALSLPEKRAFFLESLDVFGLPIAAFYSRTMSNPAWGARATWRAATADATTLSLKDQVDGVVQRGTLFETHDVLAARPSTATIMRARWHHPDWVMGSFVSLRNYGELGSNRVFGMDINWRSSELQLSGLLMHSQTDALINSRGETSDLVRAASAQFGWYGSSKLVHKNEHWFNEFAIEAISPNFINDNGFNPQTGMIKTDFNLNPRWGAKTIPWFEQALELYELESHFGWHEIRSLRHQAVGQVANQVIERKLQTGLWFRTIKRIELWGALGLDQQRANQDGKLHDVPALHLSFAGTPSTWWTKLSGDVSLGRQLDFEADKVGRGGNIKVDASFRIKLPYQWVLELDQRVNRAWVYGRTTQFGDLGYRSPPCI